MKNGTFNKFMMGSLAIIFAMLLSQTSAWGESPKAKNQDTKSSSHGTSLSNRHIEAFLSMGQGAEEGDLDFLFRGQSAQSSVDAKWTGFGLGGRLAFELIQNLYLGLEANFTRYSLVIDDSTQGINGLSYGLYAGYYFKFPMRIYLATLLSHQLQSEQSRISGQGIKLGVGYASTFPLGLNLEYLWIANSKAEFDESEVEKYKTQFSGVGLSLSYRIDL